jgi:hypothetical protein
MSEGASELSAEQAPGRPEQASPVAAVTAPITLKKRHSRRTFCGLLLLAFGCHVPRRNSRISELPQRHEVRLDQLVIRSDVKLTEDEPLLSELQELRQEIIRTLQLPPSRKQVIVHLFSNEKSYTAYMRTTFPQLPARRAFFVGSPTELTVYAFWGDNVEEDLRHEYTHGVLHASLKTVPLWLDEGLAEYFETRHIDQSRLHPEHSQRLGQALRNGWRPDLARLEKLEDIHQMQRADYQEAWAWVHYLLHEVPDGRELLIEYCATLGMTYRPPSFAALLAEHMPEPDIRLASYVSQIVPTR